MLRRYFTHILACSKLDFHLLTGNRPPSNRLLQTIATLTEPG